VANSFSTSFAQRSLHHSAYRCSMDRSEPQRRHQGPTRVKGPDEQASNRGARVDRLVFDLRSATSFAVRKRTTSGYRVHLLLLAPAESRRIRWQRRAIAFLVRADAEVECVPLPITVSRHGGSGFAMDALLRYNILSRVPIRPEEPDRRAGGCLYTHDYPRLHEPQADHPFPGPRCT
jgi:hypothetical protein